MQYELTSLTKSDRLVLDFRLYRIKFLCNSALYMRSISLFHYRIRDIFSKGIGRKQSNIGRSIVYYVTCLPVCLFAFKCTLCYHAGRNETYAIVLDETKPMLSCWTKRHLCYRAGRSKDKLCETMDSLAARKLRTRV